jgi:hypothetical protein
MCVIFMVNYFFSGRRCFHRQWNSWWLTLWITRSSRFSLSDVLIEVWCVYVFIGVSVHMCISICVCTVFLKKIKQEFNHYCSDYTNERKQKSLMICSKSSQSMLQHIKSKWTVPVKVTFSTRIRDHWKSADIFGFRQNQFGSVQKQTDFKKKRSYCSKSIFDLCDKSDQFLESKKQLLWQFFNQRCDQSPENGLELQRETTWCTKTAIQLRTQPGFPSSLISNQLKPYHSWKENGDR